MKDSFKVHTQWYDSECDISTPASGLVNSYFLYTADHSKLVSRLKKSRNYANNPRGSCGNDLIGVIVFKMTFDGPMAASIRVNHGYVSGCILD